MCQRVTDLELVAEPTRDRTSIDLPDSRVTNRSQPPPGVVQVIRSWDPPGRRVHPQRGGVPGHGPRPPEPRPDDYVLDQRVPPTPRGELVDYVLIAVPQCLVVRPVAADPAERSLVGAGGHGKQLVRAMVVVAHVREPRRHRGRVGLGRRGLWTQPSSAVVTSVVMRTVG